jgi:predicted AlkP superfamily pyrophosphatase or phosphodiesterase
MTNQKSLPSGFIKPQYETYCFSQIPNTILRLFGCGSGGLPKECTRGEDYQSVILLLIDGFGWRFLDKYKDRYPFLKRFFEAGVVSKLTSQFPSTTAAHMTTLCANQTVGEHGIYEWFMYEPLLERVVAPLLYTLAGDKKGGPLALEPALFFPEGQLFKELKRHNIRCTVFQQEMIAHSIYSKWMFDGAERIVYKSWPQALRLLKEHWRLPGFFYLYFGEFDTEAHHHGTSSPEVAQALDRCFIELEAALMSGLLPESTALIVTADHGMIDINPATTIYLNQKFPGLEHKLKKGADGHVLSPAGSCRDYFLHVQPSHLEEVLSELKVGLQEVAWVTLTSDLIEQGFFGPKGVSDRCKERMGDIAMIAKGSNSIWWYEKDRFEQKLHAMHGGLTPDELETIFLFLGKTQSRKDAEPQRNQS